MRNESSRDQQVRVRIRDAGEAVLYDQGLSVGPGVERVARPVKLRHGYYKLRAEWSRAQEVDLLVLGTRGTIEVTLRPEGIWVDGMGIHPLIEPV